MRKRILSTIVNIYLPNPSPATGDGSSNSSPHDSVGTRAACTQPVIINAGDFAQVNVIPPYAGNGRRGAAAGSRDAGASARPDSQRFVGPGHGVGSDAVVAAHAGKWVSALRTSMIRATRPDTTHALRGNHRADAFKASVGDVIGASMDAVSQAGRQANHSVDHLNASGSDKLAQTASSFPFYVVPQLWSPRETYRPGDRVAYNNNVYQVPNGGGNHAGVVPGSNDARWLYAGTVENNSRYFINQSIEQQSKT
jgi:hypothetical protein